MTAPVFLITPETLEPAGAAATATSGARLTLTGPEAHHAVSVRRLRPGERVDLVDGRGLRLLCEVTDTAADGGRRERLGVQVVERVQEPDAGLTLVLVQALAKGGRDEQAIETATEVGAELVVPWWAERCVAVWRGVKAARGRQRWQAAAREAAKQARRARVPEIAELHTTAELVDWTRRVRAAGGMVLILHEEATRPISEVVLPEAARVDVASSEPVGAAGDDPQGHAGEPPVLAVVVGPEGGISDAEVGALEDAGATMVRLGPHVLRTASAGPVALAVLAQRAGLWG
ncbi:16S rRNA (uracil(1498)-N(3))-methyltransferase [Actinomyces ruminis]|uniref:Ribosomal RNA small subunit methyltransferase E n=1 Tax=Actinomyces ruminis TaxID=1937003 RepID=A0ABX4M8U1_9ACTO|nr:16S rRNA (uracil(1498)-N(3))-methyltransferase [Actinomyces ruminis]PHP51869.1 16S rRNA (uracil(1498)-N(3))-methyltransferase [Actinomyces ruminis]